MPPVRHLRAGLTRFPPDDAIAGFLSSPMKLADYYRPAYKTIQ
ncbi:hypothetical protein [Streptomyces sp. NPDC018584]